MPRGPIAYKTLHDGDERPRFPPLFGRGHREAVLVMLATVGPMFWHEVSRSTGVSEISAIKRELGALLEAELILTNIEPGQRRWISLNTLHPWYADLRTLGRALSRIAAQKIVVAVNSPRPERLGKIVVPTRSAVEALFGSSSRTTLLLWLKKCSTSPKFLSEDTGISETHVLALLRGLEEWDIVVRHGPLVAFSKKWPAHFALRKFLGKLADVFSTDGNARWTVPVVVGSEVRTKLVALLAANGPSRYKHLSPALRARPPQVYRAALALIRLGVVQTMRVVTGDRQLSFYALDPTYAAHPELLALGRAIASGTDAPVWSETGTFVQRPFPKQKGLKGGWLFKRDRKTMALLMVHAAGSMSYGNLATALAVTHAQARFMVAHLVRDGLLIAEKKGKYVTITPDARNPYHAEISALIRRLLVVQFPDVVGMIAGLPFASKPRTING